MAAMSTNAVTWSRFGIGVGGEAEGQRGKLVLAFAYGEISAPLQDRRYPEE
jgi:hypothetical protein